MPQHVGMDSERHLGGRPKPRHHPAKGNCGHRSTALAHEDISSGFLFALETAQGAKFDAGQWMDARLTLRSLRRPATRAATAEVACGCERSSHVMFPFKKPAVIASLGARLALAV